MGTNVPGPPARVHATTTGNALMGLEALVRAAVISATTYGLRQYYSEQYSPSSSHPCSGHGVVRNVYQEMVPAPVPLGTSQRPVTQCTLGALVLLSAEATDSNLMGLWAPVQLLSRSLRCVLHWRVSRGSVGPVLRAWLLQRHHRQLCVPGFCRRPLGRFGLQPCIPYGNKWRGTRFPMLPVSRPIPFHAPLIEET